MAVVLDANNSRYYIERANECLRAALNDSEGTISWHQNLITAITLIGAARLNRRLDTNRGSTEASVKGRITKLAKQIGTGDTETTFDGNFVVINGVKVLGDLWPAVQEKIKELRQLELGKDDHGS